MDFFYPQLNTPQAADAEACWGEGHEGGDLNASSVPLIVEGGSSQGAASDIPVGDEARGAAAAGAATFKQPSAVARSLNFDVEATKQGERKRSKIKARKRKKEKKKGKQRKKAVSKFVFFKGCCECFYLNFKTQFLTFRDMSLSSPC